MEAIDVCGSRARDGRTCVLRPHGDGIAHRGFDGGVWRYAPDASRPVDEVPIARRVDPVVRVRAFLDAYRSRQEFEAGEMSAPDVIGRVNSFEPIVSHPLLVSDLDALLGRRDQVDELVGAALAMVEAYGEASEELDAESTRLMWPALLDLNSALRPFKASP